MSKDPYEPGIQKPKTVGELRELLSRYSEEFPVRGDYWYRSLAGKDVSEAGDLTVLDSGGELLFGAAV